MWRQSSKSKQAEKKFASAQEAYSCALDLLSYRDYSNKKMLERLQQKGANAEQGKEAVAKLESYGLLDEERYARRVYESWLGKRCYGRQHLQAELAKRGIRAEIAADILKLFTPEYEEQNAQNAAELFCQRNRRKLAQEADNKKIYAAAGRFMAARGFSARYMHIILDRLHFSDDM